MSGYEDVSDEEYDAMNGRHTCKCESNPYFNEFVARHAEWTEATFGPGLRTKGITTHIRKELTEIENEPTKLEEWIDVLLLGLDGARRTGANGTQIMQELERKLSVCQERVYPFPESEDHASEHVRTIDIDAEFWKGIKQAASESKWIPEEYFTNDWVYDVCEFLRNQRTETVPVVGASQRGKDWINFAQQVLCHIENYTVPQYSDKGEDQASGWSIEMLIEQTKKYANRYGKNQRKGQEVLDFMKGAHYLEMAATRFQEEQNATR